MRLIQLSTLLCLCCSVNASVLGVSSAFAAPSSIIERIRDRGFVVCGTANDEMGFSSVESDGEWSGLYIDLCRAAAIAVLGDDQKVKFVPLAAARMFTALASGSIDILARNTAWTASRDLQEGVRFAGTFFYDGKSFLIRKSSGILSSLELSGADVCVIEGSLTAASVRRYFSRRGMKYNPRQSETWTEVLENYKKPTCLVLAADTVQLAILRNSLDDKDQHSLLPEVFEVDAFGPYVSGQDGAWRRAIHWIIHALVLAEGQNVSSRTVAVTLAPAEKDKRSIFAIAEVVGRQAGFVENWFVKMIEKIGNYGEVFERNLGKGSSIGLDRGPNKPIAAGGLLQAPTLR